MLGLTDGSTKSFGTRFLAEPFDPSVETNPRSEKDDREHFQNYFTYTLSVVGFAAGYGSLWRFPNLIYQHGGGTFLIPYLLMMVLLGIPLLYLETAVGQMHQTTIPRIFQRINSSFKMVGYIIIFIAFGISVYYNTLLTYSYRYIFVSFIHPLPFLGESPSQENYYFKSTILHKSSSIEQFGIIHWELALLYIASLWICYFIIRNGVGATGKILFVTVIAPYVFLGVLILRAIKLPGSSDGLSYLFTPNLSKLFTLQIWVDATVQVFFQLAIASAGLINFASLKKKTQSFMSIIYIIPISLVICGLMCGTAIFMYVGHFCKMQNISINQLTLTGQQLAYNVIPKAISGLPWANLWLFIFSSILIMLGIDTQFGIMEAVSGTIEQDIKKFNIKILGEHVQTKHLYVFLTIIMSLFFPFFSSSAGIYYLGFFDSFISDINLPFGALIQVYVFVYLFDFTSLERQVQKSVGHKTPSYIRWALKSKLLVSLLVMVFLIGVINQMRLFSHYGVGKYIMGWCITLYPTIIAFIYWRTYKDDHYRLTFEQIQEYELQHQSSQTLELKDKI